VTEIRRARLDEAAVVGELYWRAREAAVPDIPPSVHPHDDVLDHFATVVLPQRDTWLGVDGDDVVGFIALEPGWVDHLYVEPHRTGQGIGTALLDLAKREQPAGLDLWAFQSNSGARRFYERHGFVAVAFTDGDNEEGAPDVRYRWDGTAPPT
jgi:GNAT superfamily N-acetyltransferase